MRASNFARLNPDSAEQWQERGAIMLEACDMLTGLTKAIEELRFTVIGFSGEKDYSVETGSIVHFPDQSVGINGNRGILKRTIGSCVMYGTMQQVTITKVDDLYRVGISKPRNVDI